MHAVYVENLPGQLHNAATLGSWFKQRYPSVTRADRWDDLAVGRVVFADAADAAKALSDLSQGEWKLDISKDVPAKLADSATKPGDFNLANLRNVLVLQGLTSADDDDAVRSALMQLGTDVILWKRVDDSCGVAVLPAVALAEIALINPTPWSSKPAWTLAAVSDASPQQVKDSLKGTLPLPQDVLDA